MPFGGVQMVFIGDLFQLPPVVKEDVMPYFRSHYGGIYFFDSPVFKQGFNYMKKELTQQQGKVTRRVRRVRHTWMRQILLLLSVIGPGLITANVDNDATGITGYSLAGAQYGYGLLWAVVLVTISLAVVQEMAARMGVVTGKGLSDLIRERFGVRITFWSMLLLLVANIATTVAEFAGIAGAMDIFGVSPFIAVPVAAIAVWVLVIRGSYKYVERILLALCVIYATYVASGFLVHPDWGQVFQGERMTAALLDRLTHRCHIFEMNGESFRFRESMKSKKAKKAAAE